MPSPKSIFLKLAASLEDATWRRRLGKAYPIVARINTYTTPSELRALYRLGAACPSSAKALEIGSYLGASTCYLALGLATIGGHLYCVDTWQNETMPEGERDTFAEFCQNIRAVRPQITAVRKRSSDLQPEDLSAPLHLVFIDGDHAYDSVKTDFNQVYPLLDRECVLALHDSTLPSYPGVSRLMGELLASGEWLLRGNVGSLTWLGRVAI